MTTVPARKERARARLADAAYGAGWLAVRYLPEPVVRRGFAAAADASYRRGGAGVARLRENLGRVVGTDDPEHLETVVRAGMRSYARFWRETFRLPAMDQAEIADRVAVKGTELLDGNRGRGIILALPHTGNWDAAAIWVIRYGLPFTTVAERLAPESIFDRFVAYRESLGMEVLANTGGAEPPADVLKRRLRAGRTVALVSDRDLSRRGIPVTFFGAPTSMPAGPALLAATTGAALLPVGCRFDGPDWALHVHQEILLPPGGRLRDRISTATQQLADVFAADIAAYPSDWHMLQRMW
ncbi:MAG: phosphatidylinositol mannoside acyltransferase [Mycobacteriales bacterium]